MRRAFPFHGGRLRAAAFVGTLLAASLQPEPPAAAQHRTLHLLFVGNSLTYFNDLPALVSALAEAAGEPRPVQRAVVGPGYSLEDHWNQGDALKAIEEGVWDFVVLQQGPSASEEGRTLLLRYARRFAPAIRKAGATPALYMVWPSRTRFREFGEVSYSYRLAASDIGGALFPVGEAWRYARKRDPDIPLYRNDEIHPTATGSYLGALVFVGQLYERSPVGLPASLRLATGEKIEIPADRAKVLQEAAAEALAMFPGK